MHLVSVLLTRYPDRFSSFVRRLGRCEYSHASLSLDEDLNSFYSFGYKGFTEESPEKYRRRGVKKSCCILLEVTDAAYEALCRNLDQMKARREEFRFTRLGIILCFFHMKTHWKSRYFCSRFVAEQLVLSGAVKMKKDPSLYLPGSLGTELSSASNCRLIAYDVV